MGACADLWQEEVERIVEQFTLEEIGRDDAFRELKRKGLNADEIYDILDTAVM